MTYEEKLSLYQRERYSFPPPPVCTRLWTTESWIKYIDAHGVWYPETLERKL